MGSDPGDGWPSKYEYYDEDLGEWLDERLNPRKERHVCTVEIEWKPKGKKNRVSWSFSQDDTYEDTAKLARLIEDSDGFAEECVPANVTKNEVETASLLIQCIADALHEGDRATLDRLGAMLALIDGPSKFKGIDQKRAQFVDELKELSITIHEAPNERHDELVIQLIRCVAKRYSAAFDTLDTAMVKPHVISIDPQNDKGGRGKKGPSWLGARLILDANAGDDFEMFRSGKSDDEYFAHVNQTLATARNRVKRMSSAKKP